MPDVSGDVAPDVLADTMPDVSTEDVLQDAPTDRGPDVDASSCPSIDDVCLGDAAMSCVLTWAEAQKPSTWCAPFARVFIEPGCGGYDMVIVGGVDTDRVYYYDVQTGALVGIELHGFSISSTGSGETFCVGGISPGLDTNNCVDGPAVPVDCTTDGGSDAGDALPD